MNSQRERSDESASEGGPQSFAELFHLVESLIPEDQKVVLARQDMTVAEAIGVMQENNFSQLPVVAGNTVLGVFSFRSLVSQLLKMSPTTEHFGDLPVDEFMEQFRFAQPSDNWESILGYLDRDIGVLVGHRDGLDGIVTAMDVLNYLHRIASPFVMLAEIELSLRRIIQACVASNELNQCIQNSLAQKYTADEMPTALSDMTFDDYVQIIGHGRNWPHFTQVFGKGEWQRKTTAERLRETRDLRNVVFHFRRQLTSEDYQTLATRREWLQMKTRAFEAKERDELHAPPARPKPSRRKRGEPSQERQLTKRQQQYQAFWLGLLEKAKKRTHLYDGRHSPGTDNWLGIGIGKGGVHFNLSFQQSRGAVVELGLGSPDAALNRRRFEQLRVSKAQIENDFGGSLEWVSIAGRKYCQVIHTIGGSIDTADWDTLQDQMIEAVIRLEAALRPHIEQLS